MIIVIFLLEGRMGGGLYFLVEIELKVPEIPPITNLKATAGDQTKVRIFCA